MLPHQDRVIFEKEELDQQPCSWGYQASCRRGYLPNGPGETP